MLIVEGLRVNGQNKLGICYSKIQSCGKLIKRTCYVRFLVS